MTTLSQITEHVSAIRDEVICLCDRLDAKEAAREKLRRAEYVQAVGKNFTDAELRVLFGSHYDTWTRHYMEHRLMLNVLNAAKAVRAAEGHPDPEPKSFFGTAEWARQEDAHVASRGGWAGD